VPFRLLQDTVGLVEVEPVPGPQAVADAVDLAEARAAASGTVLR
jgi:hypothetical protein